MLRASIVFALLVTFAATLAGCSREEAQMPDKVPPLPGKPTSMGTAAPLTPPPVPKK
jgi:hypothetical protein